MSSKVYLACKIRFTRAIEVLQSKKYIIVVKCAIVFDVLICNFNKVTKIFVAKIQQKIFLQTITILSEIIYINKIKINYFKYLKFVKQKTINKISKFCQIVKVISRVLFIQYKKETINKNI